MTSTARLLLVRHFRRPTGGNIKVRDYFLHAASHPAIEAELWFASGAQSAEGDIWRDFDPRHLADDPSYANYRFVCVNGKDWSLLPADTGSAEIIHFVQHAGYLDDFDLTRDEAEGIIMAARVKAGWIEAPAEAEETADEEAAPAEHGA